MRIVLTGGGTGGHIIPLITVAGKIREKAPSAEFIFIGPRGKLEENLLKEKGIKIKSIAAGKIRRYFSFANFIDLVKIPIGIVQSLGHLLFYMPDAIFSKGGYASFPIVVAGWLYRIPILIHESDSVMGLSNSVLSKFADRVAVSYPQALAEFPAAQAVLTGNPLREDINLGDPAKARERFSLLESKKVIFVWGGSQGAKAINDRIIEILPTLLKKYQVIHQTGENNFKDALRRAGELGIKAGREGYHPAAFIGEELKDVLAVSDLVISRAGANSLSEIAANSKPSIVIPIEKSANNHQRMNAYSIAKIGGCVVLEENNLGKNLLLEKIEELMNNETVRKNLSENIKNFYHPDAAERIADGVLGMIK